MRDDEKVFNHPAYGLVSFNRATFGGKAPRLFGSAVRTNQVIELAITGATRYHDLHEDRYHSTNELIRVYMTEMQFAELITTMNRGSGAPCTITHVKGERPPDIPEDELTEAALVQEGFKEKAAKMVGALNDSVKEIQSVVEKSRLPIRDKQAIMKAVDSFRCQAEHNLPFLLKQLQEAGQKVVTQLKTEVVAFTHRALEKAGLQHLKEDAPKIDFKGGD